MTGDEPGEADSDTDASANEEAPSSDDPSLHERAERAVKIVLLALLALSLIGVAYVAIDPPRATDPYSEFYLLGPTGNASNYPTELAPGETGTVIVGVTNHEGQPTEYQLRVVDTNATRDGTLATASRRIGPEETWETTVSLSFAERGRHRVQFQLYKNTIEGDPYLTTRLWINVTSTPATVLEPTAEPQAVVRR